MTQPLPTPEISGCLPVSVAAENSYGHTPEVASTIRRVAETGAVGASIEDYAAAQGAGELYDRVLAVERIRAAAATATSLPFPFTLTARAECYLVGHPKPFGESVARATSYREAGADCLAGPCGTGKSHIAQALGHAAVRADYDVLFTTQSRLLASLNAARAINAYERRFQTFAGVLLLVDDRRKTKEIVTPSVTPDQHP